MDHTNFPILSERELLYTAQSIYSYLDKCNYCSQYNLQHLPPAEEYLEFCSQARRFVESISRFQTYINIEFHEPYVAIFQKDQIKELLHFVILWDYYEENHKPMPITRRIWSAYFAKNGHLADLALYVDLLNRDSDGELTPHWGELITPNYGHLYDLDQPNSNKFIYGIPLISYTIRRCKFRRKDSFSQLHFPFLVVEDGLVARYLPQLIIDTY